MKDSKKKSDVILEIEVQPKSKKDKQMSQLLLDVVLIFLVIFVLIWYFIALPIDILNNIDKPTFHLGNETKAKNISLMIGKLFCIPHSSFSWEKNYETIPRGTLNSFLAAGRSLRQL